jgi:hypothetical protein
MNSYPQQSTRVQIVQFGVSRLPHRALRCGPSIQAIYSAEVPAYARGRLCLTGDAGTVFRPFSGSGVLKAIGNATSLHDSLAAAATIGQGLSAWSKQQQATIEALQPVAERIGKNLISEIPDLTSLSAADSYSWLSAIHPGAHITLPGSRVAFSCVRLRVPRRPTRKGGCADD